MKLKFLLPAALCLSISNTGYALTTETMCCDLSPSLDGTCKCYGIGNDCSHCYGGSGGDCTDCESTDWAASGTDGYESRIIASCLLGRCNKLTNYRCAKGWYGSATKLTDSLNGCARCPSSGGVYGTTLLAGNDNVIEDCYIPGGTVATDGTGTFEYTADCYYSN